MGFETLTPENLRRSQKRQNLGRDYSAVTARLHSLGIMINGSFVFGMDEDDEEVFRRTVDWAIDASPVRCSTACAGWIGCFRAPPPSIPSCATM